MARGAPGAQARSGELAMTRLLTTVAVSALVLGLGASVVSAQTTSPAPATAPQMQTQTQAAPAPAQPASQPAIHHAYRHSAQWEADHSANELNRDELARIEGASPSYGASR
jgi:hypothetical protein